jgi:hypothetical protein
MQFDAASAQRKNTSGSSILPHSAARPLALQNVAESSYYIGIVLLYRTFIERLTVGSQSDWQAQWPSLAE